MITSISLHSDISENIKNQDVSPVIKLPHTSQDTVWFRRTQKHHVLCYDKYHLRLKLQHQPPNTHTHYVHYSQTVSVTQLLFVQVCVS